MAARVNGPVRAFCGHPGHRQTLFRSERTSLTRVNSRVWNAYPSLPFLPFFPSHPFPQPFAIATKKFSSPPQPPPKNPRTMIGTRSYSMRRFNIFEGRGTRGMGGSMTTNTHSRPQSCARAKTISCGLATTTSTHPHAKRPNNRQIANPRHTKVAMWHSDRYPDLPQPQPPKACGLIQPQPTVFHSTAALAKSRSLGPSNPEPSIQRWLFSVPFKPYGPEITAQDRVSTPRPRSQSCARQLCVLASFNLFLNYLGLSRGFATRGEKGRESWIVKHTPPHQ